MCSSKEPCTHPVVSFLCISSSPAALAEACTCLFAWSAFSAITLGSGSQNWAAGGGGGCFPLAPGIKEAALLGWAALWWLQAVVFSAAVIRMIIVTARESNWDKIWFSTSLYHISLIKDLSSHRLALEIEIPRLFFKETNHVKPSVKKTIWSPQMKISQALKVCIFCRNVCRSHLYPVLFGSQSVPQILWLYSFSLAVFARCE